MSIFVVATRSRLYEGTTSYLINAEEMAERQECAHYPHGSCFVEHGPIARWHSSPYGAYKHTGSEDARVVAAKLTTEEEPVWVEPLFTHFEDFKQTDHPVVQLLVRVIANVHTDLQLADEIVDSIEAYFEVALKELIDEAKPLKVVK